MAAFAQLVDAEDETVLGGADLYLGPARGMAHADGLPVGDDQHRRDIRTPVQEEFAPQSAGSWKAGIPGDLQDLRPLLVYAGASLGEKAASWRRGGGMNKDRFARQVLLFGEEGQRQLAESKVRIVVSVESVHRSRRG